MPHIQRLTTRPTLIVESVAEEAMRATSIIAALEKAEIPFDSMTVVALEMVVRHVESALMAEAERADAHGG